MSSTIPLWRRCLDPSTQEADHYRDYVHTPLLSLIEGAPSRVLDLGCAAGALGHAMKARFPGATVVGVESGQGAARVAAGRLDRVIVRRIEELDLAAEGFEHGEFDAVVASDILEHLFNPWEALDRVRPFLSESGQVIASIPNVRNVTVSGRLLGDGAFRYDERGLLDITHLRFFTLSSIQQLFAEAGYRMEKHVALLLPSLEETYRQHKGAGSKQLRLGRITIDDVTPQDLIELCTAQYLIRARRVEA